MNKYIDAEKLKAFKEALADIIVSSQGLCTYDACKERSEQETPVLLGIINSLQQEQPRTCKTCSFYENDCPFNRGKFTLYPNKVCKDYTPSVTKEQEQPTKGYDEAYLNECIAKARKTWKGVDVDKYMDEVRGREQERPEAELGKDIEWEWAHREKQEVDLIECAEMDKDEFARFARHFYKLGLKVRKEE